MLLYAITGANPNLIGSYAERFSRGGVTSSLRPNTARRHEVR
jgi:hypothetical protein